MSQWLRGMRIGGGLVGFGWGLYRFTNRKRDMLTWTALTTGASVLAREMLGTRSRATRLIGVLTKATRGVGNNQAMHRALAKAVAALGVRN